MNSIAPALVDELARLVSPGTLVTDAALLPDYGRDFWGPRGVPGVVVRAARVEDVAATLRFAQQRGVPVVPRAAGTNIGGGYLPAPGRILLDLRPLDRVIRVDAERREAVVEPGALNGALQERLAPLGLCWSPDPASAPLSTIGGNIAENAGGPHCLKYGVTVHHVAALTCVLPGGDLVRLDARDAGPDLRGVVIGSEGTLAIVAEATLRLRPLPAVTRTLLAVFDHAEEAAAAVSAIIAGGVIPAALELFDRQSVLGFEAYAPTGYPTDAEALLLIDCDGDPDEVAREMAAVESRLRGVAREVRRADDEAGRAALWRGRLQSGQAIAASGLGFLIGDTTVPRERIPEMQRAIGAVARRHNLRILTVGHAGDGNVHPTIVFDRADAAALDAVRAASGELVSTALELGGTLTGEHGVGSEKRPYMRKRFNAAELAAMRAVKSVFDPGGILNPGVLLPDPDAAAGEPSLPRFTAAMRAALDARRGAAPTPSLAPWRKRVNAAPPPRGERTGPNAGPVGSIGGAETGDGDGGGLGVQLDVENLTVTAGAGIALDALRQVLADRGLRSALTDASDPADPGATVGDAVGDAAYQSAAQDCLLAVRAALPDSASVRFGSKAVKDVAGYDLKRLYIGSGASFGTLDEVTLQVRPRRQTAGKTAPGST